MEDGVTQKAAASAPNKDVARLSEIMKQINSQLSQETTNNAVEFELAALASVAPKIISSASDSNYELMRSAVLALSGDRPNVLFSQEIRKRLSEEIDTTNPNETGQQLLYGLLLGGLITLALAAILAYVITRVIPEIIPNPAGFFWLVLSAFLGASIRLTIRFGQLKLRHITEASPFFSGISGPFLGICASLFVYSLFKTKFVQIGALDFQGPAEVYATIVLGFVCGYVVYTLIEVNPITPSDSTVPYEAKLDRTNPFHISSELSTTAIVRNSDYKRPPPPPSS